jgi:predicted exporter
MNQDTIKQITDALSPVAQKLGEGAGALFQIYVRQEIIQGIEELGGAALLLIVALIFTAITFKTWKWACKRDLEIFTGMATGTAIVVALIVAPFLVFDGLPHLINPQYYAIQDISCTVRSCGN